MSSSKLNPLAPEYTRIQPGITANSNQPFSALLHRLVPSETPQQQFQTPFFSSHFYAYFSSTSVQVQPSYYVPQNPPRLVGPGLGQREVVDGRSVSGQRGKGVFGGDERKWGPVCNEKEVLGFEREVERSVRQQKQKQQQQHEVVPLKWEEEKTSVMIKNIPYDCPKEELMKVLDGFCMMENEKSNEEVVAYDFLYLPIDFRTKKGRGFAFVNFTNAKSVRRFFDVFHLAKWDAFRRWTKTIEIVTAKIQGKEALVEHFSKSHFVCETNEFLPVTFNPARDGSGQNVDMTVIGNRGAFQRWGTRKA